MKISFTTIAVAICMIIFFFIGLTATIVHDNNLMHKDTFNLRVTALPATDTLTMNESPRMSTLDILLRRARLGDSSGKYMVLSLREETALMKWQFKYANMPDSEVVLYDEDLLQDTQTRWINKIYYLKGQWQKYRDSLRYRPELINR